MQQNQLGILVALCEATGWHDSTDAVFQRIVDVSVEQFGCDEAHFRVVDSSGKGFLRCASHGATPQHLMDKRRVLSVDVGRMRDMLETGAPIVSDYSDPHPNDIHMSAEECRGHVGSITIPIRTPHSGILGTLDLVYAEMLPKHDEFVEFLTMCGKMLGIQVERIIKSKRDLELQILQERNMLSSELHDNVSQLISALAIYAETALICYREGDEVKASEQLVNLCETSRKATKVLREEMLSLRTPCSDTEDFSAVVADILLGFGQRWGIETSFEVSPNNRPVCISTYATLQLTRILNEALSNIFKHSGATSVQVCMIEGDTSVVLIVDDNGRGFDVGSVPEDRLGIRIMRERASAVGGKIFVESCDRGTTVCASVPR